jgi:Ca-activated chloride channel family protein
MPAATPAAPRASTSTSPAATTTPADGGAADDDALQSIDPADVIRVNSNLVPVTASVVDVQGKAITNLKLEDFELKVDGQPKPISEIGFSNTPVRLVMLFDNSSSLSAAREFEKKAAIRFFRNVLRPVDEAAIFSISTVPILEQSLTSNVQTLVRTIEHFGKPEGATALFDAIAQAAAYLRPLQGRKVIVIVSDGADTISDLDFDSTLRLAQAADCQIYAVQTGQLDYDMQTGEFKNANVRDLAAERRMQEMSVQTGGAVYVPRGTADLDTAFSQISADLAQQYILSYYPTDDKRDGRFRVISLRVATRPNARVRARKGYYTPKG